MIAESPDVMPRRLNSAVITAETTVTMRAQFCRFMASTAVTIAIRDQMARITKITIMMFARSSALMSSKPGWPSISRLSSSMMSSRAAARMIARTPNPARLSADSTIVMIEAAVTVPGRLSGSAAAVRQRAA